MTKSEIADIHLALTKANGERAAAARTLDITVTQLNALMDSVPELKAFWAPGAVETTQAEAYDRDRKQLPKPPPEALDADVDLGGFPAPLPEPPARTANTELVGAVLSQDRKLQKADWEGLGVKNENTIQLMRQFEAFAGTGVYRTLDVVFGGLNRAFAEMSARFVHAAEMLEDEEVKKSDVKRLYWHGLFMDYGREVRAFHKDVMGAMSIRLQALDRAKKMQNAQEKVKQQPAWGNKGAKPTPPNGGPKHA